MDIRSFIRPILAGLVVLGLIVLVIVFLVRIFSGPKISPLTAVDVGIYAHSNAEATLVMLSPNVLDENFRQVKITISQYQNEIDLIQGYQGHIIQTKTYDTNSAAFATFLQSQKLKGFSSGTTKNSGDYRGYCPFGSRYLYSFNDGNSDLFNYWSTSCGSQGTFRGSAHDVRRLFMDQIPQADLNKILSGTNIII
jgi:hypothetical protein